MTFQTFHGSPGSPEDFYQLESSIGGTWSHQDRRQSPRVQKQSLVEDSILVGYSWGCRELFRSLSTEDKRPATSRPLKIVLISPFLFTEPVRFFKKTVLNTPGVGTLLIASQAETAVKAFIQESSSPQKPSKLYSLQKDKLKETQTLRSAVLEKDIFRIQDIPEGLEALVIWGNKDQTSSRKNQIDPLMKKLDIASQLITVENGGHALPWNNAQDISNIIKNKLKLFTGGPS